MAEKFPTLMKTVSHRSTKFNNMKHEAKEPEYNCTKIHHDKIG